jgi:hypothetical protein
MAFDRSGNVTGFSNTTVFEIVNGGTGASTAQQARINLGVVGPADTQILTNKTIDGANNTISNIGLTTQVTGTLPVGNGGTGATTLTSNNVILGNGTSAVQFVAPGTAGNVLKSNGTTWESAAEDAQVYPGVGLVISTGTAWDTSKTAPTGDIVGTSDTQTLTNKTISGADNTLTNLITRDTEQTTTSGSNKDFTGIPSWVKKITVMFNAVSFSSGVPLLVRLGDSGGFETTGYVSTSGFISSGGATITNKTDGFVINSNNAGHAFTGIMEITNISGNVWVSSHSVRLSDTIIASGGGVKTLSDPLTQISIVGGTFDNGSVNIMYQ